MAVSCSMLDSLSGSGFPASTNEANSSMDHVTFQKSSRISCNLLLDTLSLNSRVGHVS